MRALIVGTPGLEEPAIVGTVLDEVAPTEVIHNDSPTGVDAAVAAWCAANSVPEIVVPLDQTKGVDAYNSNIEEMIAHDPEVTLSFVNENEPYPITPTDARNLGLNMRYTNIFPPGTVINDEDWTGREIPRFWQTIWQAIRPSEPVGTTGS